MRSLTVSLVLVVGVCVGSAGAFFATKPTTTNNKKAKVSPFTEEAIAIFDKNFPFGREPPKRNPFVDFGMPNQDFDGTRVKSKNPSKKRLTDITPEQAKKSFNELARLYGDDRALKMVKAQPICLAFDSTNFDPCLENWSNVFGLEAAQEMVVRNPGLLAVRPGEAAKATDSTMVFSYIVAITRPVGGLLLATLFLLLLTPVIESITGIQYGINH
mmetsp:Transcript_93057/g.267734  ORF Transcript_93057/g.267734 Transcript_93057/m.267734 type:complete len:215 (-) Transcript_93057:149-793(-)